MDSLATANEIERLLEGQPAPIAVALASTIATCSPFGKIQQNCLAFRAEQSAHVNDRAERGQRSRDYDDIYD